MDKLACWIDLQIPFKGDYTEALATDTLVQEYNYWMNIRKIAEAEDAENIAEFIRDGQPNGSGSTEIRGLSGFSESSKQSSLSMHKIFYSGCEFPIAGVNGGSDITIYSTNGNRVPHTISDGKVTLPAPGLYIVVRKGR